MGLFEVFDILKYRMAGKFGGEFNLAVWWIMNAPPNLIPPIFCHDMMWAGSRSEAQASSRSSTHNTNYYSTSVSDLPEIASRQLVGQK